jgi:hypothetical protein
LKVEVLGSALCLRHKSARFFVWWSARTITQLFSLGSLEVLIVSRRLDSQFSAYLFRLVLPTDEFDKGFAGS